MSSLGTSKPTAIVVYGVWFNRKYGSDRGTSLDKLFVSERQAHEYARRCRNGLYGQTGDSWFVREHALHLQSEGT